MTEHRQGKSPKTKASLLVTYPGAGRAAASLESAPPFPATPAIAGEPACANYRGAKRLRPVRVTILCARAKEVFPHWTSPLDDDEVPPGFCTRECPSFRQRP